MANKQCACGHQLAEGARFCSGCGRPTVRPEAVSALPRHQAPEIASEPVEWTTGAPQRPATVPLSGAIARWSVLLVLLFLVVGWLHRPLEWLCVVSGIGLLVGLTGYVAAGPDETPEKTMELRRRSSAIGAISLLSFLATGPWWQPAAHQEVPGEVLIAGGSNSKQVLDSAELYNPVTGLFSATGSMTTPRLDSAAVLLGNGKVLVTGGTATVLAGPDWAAPLETAELYDPQTGTFSRTGNMNQARSGHTATVLFDGRVLIAGGDGGRGRGTNETAELYDPASGTFIPTGPMNHPRELHTATLLKDGAVLIAAGLPQDASETAEVYDPQSGAFTPTTNMIARCGGNRAALLADGQVLIAGSEFRYMTSTYASVYVPCAELYDPQSGTFNRLARVPSVCGVFAMTSLGDARALLAGGSDDCNPAHCDGGSAAALFVGSTLVPPDRENERGSLGLQDDAAWRWASSRHRRCVR